VSAPFTDELFGATSSKSRSSVPAGSPDDAEPPKPEPSDEFAQKQEAMLAATLDESSVQSQIAR
jgi:hypothetical protein